MIGLIYFSAYIAGGGGLAWLLDRYDRLEHRTTAITVMAVYVAVPSVLAAILASVTPATGLFVVGGLILLGLIIHPAKVPMKLALFFIFASNTLNIMENIARQDLYPSEFKYIWGLAGLGFGAMALWISYRRGLHT